MNSRNKLLQAAAELFGVRGVAGTTTAAIADEAGVAEVTLFRHFGDKGALFVEAMQHIRKTGGVGELPAEVSDRPEQDIRAFALRRKESAGSRTICRGQPRREQSQSPVRRSSLRRL